MTIAEQLRDATAAYRKADDRDDENGRARALAELQRLSDEARKVRR